MPRALSLDLRRTEKHIVLVTPKDKEVRPFQNGRWNNRILCGFHESSLTHLDKYGVEFVRSASGGTRDSTHFHIPNPTPRLLRDFALSIIWRADIASQSEGNPSELGPYVKRIESTLFEGANIDARVFLVQPNITGNGELLEIGSEPVKVKHLGAPAWKFGFGQLDILVRLGRHPIQSHLEFADASKNTSAFVLVKESSDIRSIEAFKDMMNML